MSDMTDERAAEVLAAHNEWRRYDGETGEPGAPAMGDPTELGLAIDHAVSRLRSQPPAEAHCATCACSPGMTAAVRFDASAAEREGAVRDHLIRMGWTPPAEAQAAPPSAPVGVEAKDAEIEALRAEVAAWEGLHASEVQLRQRWQARAERLAEALRWYANPEVYKPHPHGPAFDDRDLSFKARAALHDHDQEEGSGAFWGSSPKSGGPDWTGFDG